MAWRWPVKRLKSVDLPTLGRPTMATIPDGCREVSCRSAPAAAARARPRRGGAAHASCSAPGVTISAQLLERTALVGEREAVEVAGPGGGGGDDDVHVVEPGMVGVELRRPGRVVGVAVPEADDVEAALARVAVGAHDVRRVEQVAVARALGVRVRARGGLNDLDARRRRSARSARRSPRWDTRRRPSARIAASASVGEDRPRVMRHPRRPAVQAGAEVAVAAVAEHGDDDARARCAGPSRARPTARRRWSARP